MIRFSSVKPIVIPSITDVGRAQIDRAQSMEVTGTTNREKNKEIGRDGTVDYAKKTPSITYTLTQKESLNIAFFRSLANIASGAVNLSQFTTAAVDILWYVTDDSGTVLGTLWYPKLRTTGFSINIADPDAIIDRNFNLAGEAARFHQGVNKYVIFKQEVVDTGETAGGGDWSVVLNDPAPVVDPNNAGVYMLRVTRIRAGVSTDLVVGTAANQYEYTSGTTTLEVHGAALSDEYKIWYSASTYGTGTIWADNNVDSGGALAYQVTAYIGNINNQLTRVQGITIDVTFDRFDTKEVGNKEVVQRGVNQKTVTVTLPRKLEDYVLDEVLLGESAGHGIIDLDNYLDTTTMLLKIYETSAKSTFAWGVKITNLTPSEVSDAIGIDAYQDRGTTLTSELMTISDLESDIAF